MNNDCIDVERIPEVLKLRADDPERRHVETCPRCSAILASYRAFMKAEIIAGSDPDDADTRLTAFLTSKIGAPQDATEDVTGAEDLSRKGFLPRIIEGFFMRPAWVAALLLIIVAGVFLWRPWTSEQTVLRGSSQVGVPQPLTLSAPQKLPGDRVRLEWTPMAGADSYQVRLYDKYLNGIARLEPTHETELIIDRSMLPIETPDELIWRVVALKRGDEIGSSDPASLVLR
jgi:hypothetical protein